MRAFPSRASLVLSIAGLVACATPPAAAPTLDAERLAAIVAAPDRSDADRRTDVRRKPVELLAFVGVRPGMQVLDVSAGGGYTSELLARAVGPGGHVWGQSTPPDPTRVPPAAPEGGDGGGARPAAAPAPAPRTTAMRLAERANAAGLANLSSVVTPFERPAGPDVKPGSLDLVTLMFNYHDLGHLGVDRRAMNLALFAALKPGGVYVVADHAGRPGTGITESGTQHRVEEDFVVREIEAAGFRLADRGFFLRNPNDPRDRNEPDPPMPKDEFVLKFVRLPG